MLREAYDLYQVEVVNQGKLYQRYADDFVYSHEFHDDLDAWSKNEHQKNYRILDSLLSNRRDLIELFFNKENISAIYAHALTVMTSLLLPIVVMRLKYSAKL